MLVAHQCQPLPVEMVVRAYLTGTTSTSIWVHYARGERVFCGHTLPNDLRQHQALPEPILTPSTKAEKGDHDVSASREEILRISKMDPKDFNRAAELAFALFRRGQQLCAERGLILVDTKYEFGRAPDGRIVVIDEIHTPDSSRFWKKDSYAERFAHREAPESLDKEYLRRHLAERGFRGDGPIPRFRTRCASKPRVAISRPSSSSPASRSSPTWKSRWRASVATSGAIWGPHS
ncbi:MAG: phosphoribosylaminoimidazolesuccinocarboxamide synthase [Polyangiaceae bacterium]